VALRFGQWPLDRPAHQMTAAQTALLAAALTRPTHGKDAPVRLTPAELAELARRHEESIHG